MTNSIPTLSLAHLAVGFVPVAATLFVLAAWSLDLKKAIYALCRMLVQLLLIGYFLAYLFQTERAEVILAVLLVMVMASSWIALGNIKSKRAILYKKVFVSIGLGGGITLLIVTQVVLHISPWFSPKYMIPLAGMIFASSMNTVSLTAERVSAEIGRGESYLEARRIALHAALIPNMNALFAVGLVSLPGMMTGQILSGVSPLIAARYQIMVMCMIFGAAGISAALFLILGRGELEQVLPQSE
jgi:putative ABC transport system permease protein